MMKPAALGVFFLSLLGAGFAGARAEPADAVMAHLAEEAPLEAHPDGVFLDSIARAGHRLVAAGERGVIIVSDDNGISWRQAAAPAAGTLTSVRFADALNGWVVGHLGLILHTQDGGLHWTRQFDGVRAAHAVLAQAQHAADLPLPSEEHARASQRLEMAKRLVEDGPDAPFLAVLAESATDAIAVGAYNLAFATTDGGMHWLPWGDRIANPQSLHLYAPVLLDGVTYIGGEQGLVVRSAPSAEAVADGRSTRRPAQLIAVEAPFAGSFFGGLAAPGHRIILYGLQGAVLVSADDGGQWQRARIEDGAAINCGAALKSGAILLGDRAGRLFASFDQGATFVATAYGGPGVNDLTEAEDGTLILATDSGMRRVGRAVLDDAAHTGGSP